MLIYSQAQEFIVQMAVVQLFPAKYYSFCSWPTTIALSYYSDRTQHRPSVPLWNIWIFNLWTVQGMSFSPKGVEKRKVAQEYRKEYQMEVEESYEETSGRSVHFVHIHCSCVPVYLTTLSDQLRPLKRRTKVSKWSLYSKLSNRRVVGWFCTKIEGVCSVQRGMFLLVHMSSETTWSSSRRFKTKGDAPTQQLCTWISWLKLREFSI